MIITSPALLACYATLQWFPELGLGYYPVTESPYDGEYWDKYVKYADTDLGRQIAKERIAFVDGFYQGQVLDVGIGCGDFVTKRNQWTEDKTTFGYDINPVGVAWLESNGLYLDPYKKPVFAATFWDVFEHIHDHSSLLQGITGYIFMSVPIFTGPDDVMQSKHFRKDEHCWYWTPKGLEQYMAGFGFTLIGESDFETRLGRESIGSYAFKRTTFGPTTF